MTDAIEHPVHYNSHASGVEAIVICEWLGFCAGNALKYAWRAGHKGKLREDLQKSLWYVRRMRETPVLAHRGLPSDIVPVARRVVNSEPRGSLLAVLIHQLALPAIVRDEHLENAEYALVKAIGEIKVHKSVTEPNSWDKFQIQIRAACNTELLGAEFANNPAEVTCEECRRLA